MATEVQARQVSGTQAEQLSLSTTVTAIGVPPGRDGSSVRGVLLRCSTSDFRYHINPAIRVFSKDAAGTVTAYAAQVRDRSTSTTATLSSLDTGANSHFVYIGAAAPFGGVRLTIGSANSTASVLSGKYWTGSAWSALTLTDGTTSGGATLAATGNVTWTVPTDWAAVKEPDAPTITQEALYLARLQVDTQLDSSVTITEAALLNKDTNRGYGYSGTPILLPLGNATGSLEGLVGSGSATLDLTWFFDGVPVAISASGASSGTQYADGAQNDGPTGTLSMWNDSSTSPDTQKAAADNAPFPVQNRTSGGTELFTVSNPGQVTQAALTRTTDQVSVGVNTTGGATTTSFVTAASNNATSLKASAGTLYGLQAFNLAAYPLYVKFYNKASAPAPGSDTAILTVMVPNNSTAANGAGSVVKLGPEGVAFSTGIAYAVVKGISATDNTSVAASDGVVSIQYA